MNVNPRRRVRSAPPVLAAARMGLLIAAQVAILSLINLSAARKRFASPLTTPIVLSTAVVIAALTATQTTLSQYDSAKEIVTIFLGPATVALAVPLFKNRHRVGRNGVPALAGLAAGSLSTMVVAALIARACGFAPVLASSIALK